MTPENRFSLRKTLILNIVGYAPTGNEGAKAPIVGGQFFAVDGSATFDLQKFTVPGTREWNSEDEEWNCTYMNAGTEFLRVLDTTTLADDSRYTYISEEFIIDNVGELSGTGPDEIKAALAPYKWAVGWWKYPVKGNVPKYASIIESGEEEGKKSEYYIGAAVNLNNGTAFVGYFAVGKKRDLVSNGEVKTQTFGYSTAGAKAPVFNSQLPVSIDLQDLSIPGSKEWNSEDEEWNCTYMNAGTEFLRLLNTTTLADDSRYTYISEEFIIDNVGDLSGTGPDEIEEALAPYKWAIGWWKYPVKGNVPKYAAIIEEGEEEGKKSEYYLGTTKVPVAAGAGFVGYFAAGKVRQVNFPSALDVPSKQ